MGVWHGRDYVWWVRIFLLIDPSQRDQLTFLFSIFLFISVSFLIVAFHLSFNFSFLSLEWPWIWRWWCTSAEATASTFSISPLSCPWWGAAAAAWSVCLPPWPPLRMRWVLAGRVGEEGMRRMERCWEGWIGGESVCWEWGFGWKWALCEILDDLFWMIFFVIL